MVMLVGILTLVVCFAVYKVVSGIDWNNVSDDEETYQYWKEHK